MIIPYIVFFAAGLTAVGLYGIVLACTMQPPEGY